MKPESLEEIKEKIKRLDEFVWDLIVYKLKKNNQTIDWLSEQVSAGKKNFYWNYHRKRIHMELLNDVSVIFKHDFFEYFSMYTQKMLEMKNKERKK